MIGIYRTPDEWDPEIRAAADRAGLPVIEWVRSVIRQELGRARASHIAGHAADGEDS